MNDVDDGDNDEAVVVQVNDSEDRLQTQCVFWSYTTVDRCAQYIRRSTTLCPTRESLTLSIVTVRKMTRF